MSWKDTISKNLIKSVKFGIGNVKFIDDDIIECYNCRNELKYERYISCDGKCYWCFECCEYQHINKENKITKGHNITCDEYYNCDECNKTTIGIDNNNYIDFIDNDFPDESFIFDKDINTNIKYNNKYYHYECFCKFLGDDYMNLVCNKCKRYCKDINNMRDINNDPKIIKGINVCVECYDNTDIRKCYNNSCKGERVVMQCYFYSQCKKYAKGCIECTKNDWIKEYCNECR